MLTSFLFLIPAALAFYTKRYFLGSIFTILSLISFVNHTDKYKFIEPIDQTFCWIIGLVLFAISVYHRLYIPMICAILSALLFFVRSHILAHVLLHIISTIGFAFFVQITK